MSVFLTIKETATRSGLSQFYIRNRCKDGTIPHRMMGIKYMVDYEAFIEREHRLAAQSVAHQLGGHYASYKKAPTEKRQRLLRDFR